METDDDGNQNNLHCCLSQTISKDRNIFTSLILCLSFPIRFCRYVLKRKTLSTMPPTCCRTQIWPWGWLWGQTLLALRSFLAGSSTLCLPREVIQKPQRLLHQHPRYVCPLLQCVVVTAHWKCCLHKLIFWYRSIGRGLFSFDIHVFFSWLLKTLHYIIILFIDIVWHYLHVLK